MMTQMVPRFGRLEIQVNPTDPAQGFDEVKPTDTYAFNMVTTDPLCDRDRVTLNGQILGSLLELRDVKSLADAETVLYQLANGSISINMQDGDGPHAFLRKGALMGPADRRIREVK